MSSAPQHTLSGAGNLGKDKAKYVNYVGRILPGLLSAQKYPRQLQISVAENPKNTAELLLYFEDNGKRTNITFKKPDLTIQNLLVPPPVPKATYFEVN